MNFPEEFGIKIGEAEKLPFWVLQASSLYTLEWKQGFVPHPQFALGDNTLVISLNYSDIKKNYCGKI